MFHSGSDGSSAISSSPQRSIAHRRLLNEQEVAITQELASAVSSDSANGDFACSGVLSSTDLGILSQLRVFYEAVEDGVGAGPPKVVKLPLDTKSAIELYESAEPSPFGRGKELVYDEGYRQAREIKSPHFALSADPLADSAIPTILMQRLNYTSPLSFRINKMNMYAQGGFFRSHVDTPQGRAHIGTLVLCLPSQFRGGDLVVSHGDATVTFDWCNQVANGDIAWGFLYSDCKHEVLPVEDGIRITLQYDVFITHTSSLINDRMYDTRSEVVKQAFNRIMSPSFIPEGGELAFGLKYEYPIGDDYRGVDWTALEKVLKGIDAIFMSCLKATGLHFRSFGVYDAWQLDMDREDRRSTTSLESDELTPEEEEDVTFHKDIWTADTCRKASGTHWESDDPEDLSLERDLDLIWITVPEHFNVDNQYTTYGNEMQTHSIYAAVGIKVYLPPGKERSPIGGLNSPNKRRREN